MATIDATASQPRQRLVEGGANVLWVGIHDPAWLSTDQTKLCSKEDLVALSRLLEATSRAEKERVMSSGAEIYGSSVCTIS